MIDSTSDNTKAVLLLCAPLLIGKNTPMVDLLKPTEYNLLAKWLHEHQWQPADLIAENARAIIQACPVVMPERLSTLLGRGFQLSQALDQWASRSIWVISRSDATYPKRFKERLGKDAPALLYACGNPDLAEQGGLAVVGSRKVTDELLTYTRNIGEKSASQQEQIISGGAKGVDLTAMLGALAVGGNVVGVLADSLSRVSVQRELRQGLMENRLLLLSHVDPNASFNVGMAMQRNKYIYALADQALVVNADLRKGGTWAGADEQLIKYQFVPVYVRAIGEPSPALTALQAMGAKRYEMPDEAPSMSTNTATLDLFDAPTDTLVASQPIKTPNQPEIASLADQLFDHASALILQQLSSQPRREKELAALLGLVSTQVKQWLLRLEASGLIEKYKTKYRVVENRLI